MTNDNEPTLKEHLKEQKKIEKDKLKTMTFSEKVDYIWTYYKAPILITAFILVFVISMGYHLIFENQESVLYTMAINATATQTDDARPEFIEEFMTEQKFDPKDYKIDFHNGLYITLNDKGEASDMQTFSVVATLLMSGTVDNILTDEDVVVMLAEIGYIMPAEWYLSEEELAAYDEEGKIIYATEPETKQRMAFGVSLKDSQKMTDSNLFPQTPVFAMVYQAPHQNNAAELLHFLEP